MSRKHEQHTAFTDQMIEYIVPRDRVFPKTTTMEFLLSAHHSPKPPADGKAGRTRRERSTQTKNDVSRRRGSAPRGRGVEPAGQASVVHHDGDPHVGPRQTKGPRNGREVGEWVQKSCASRGRDLRESLVVLLEQTSLRDQGEWCRDQWMECSDSVLMLLLM